MSHKKIRMNMSEQTKTKHISCFRFTREPCLLIYNHKIAVFRLSELTIAKKMATCQFYRDPLQKANFMCLRTVIRLIF